MVIHHIAIALLVSTSLLAAPLALAQATMPVPTTPATNGYPAAPRDPSLKPVFAEFGGKAGLVSLVNDFMDNLMADPITHPFFAPVDREQVKKGLVDQFCDILDGPCTYAGPDMSSLHHGMGINRADFNALVVDLQKAMTKHHIPFRAQNKLLAKLAPMGHQIITKP